MRIKKQTFTICQHETEAYVIVSFHSLIKDPIIVSTGGS